MDQYISHSKYVTPLSLNMLVKGSQFYFFAQVKEIVENLDKLQNNADKTDLKFPETPALENKIMKGYFSSDTVFNFTTLPHPESKISTLEKALDFAPIQRKVN